MDIILRAFISVMYVCMYIYNVCIFLNVSLGLHIFSPEIYAQNNIAFFSNWFLKSICDTVSL